ncbi:hypothetical protein [Flavobacterium sp.]|uniref:hypothetical protein n=1 Tax=Flavobacterium sp. TaxID=239 RepID=UPI0032665A7D
MTKEIDFIQPLTDTTQQKQHIVLRFFAHFFSVVFHPLFIPFYVVAFLVYYHPSYFSGFSYYTKVKLLLTTALNTVFFPAFAILVMKGLGFVKSIFLRTQQDRIGPYLSSMIFYFWAARVFFKFQPELTPVLAIFMTGVFLTTAAALIANIFFKISMHAIGCGGMIGIFIIIMFSNTMLMTWPLCIALLITGLVCTSRLIVSDHTEKDIYLGLAVGLICQFAAGIVLI